MIFYSFLKGNLSWRKWSALLTKFSGRERKRGLDIVERGRVLKRHGLFFYSPSQTGKASGFKYLCRTDRVDYSLGFINGSASEARLCGFELDLALAEKVRDLKFWCRADELYFCERSEVVWYILAFPDGEGGRPRCWCRSDRVDYSLGFIYGSASEARLYGVLIKELIDKKAYLGIFAALRKQQAKTFTTAAMLQELHLIPWLRQDLGMIQQERQNNIINILGGHSYAM